MLEDLAATILQRLLGRYVQGLEARNLRVAVWSGRVVLENLMLRPEALSGILPVHVREGFIGRIEMVVPWHKLKSLPVTIELQEVLVLAAPLNQRSWTDDDEKAHRATQKRLQLRAYKRELQRFVDDLKGHRPELEGELVPLLSRVLDNVQLTISSLHLRYEDVTNVPRQWACALGLRLRVLRIKSADQHGRARFVDRTPVLPASLDQLCLARSMHAHTWPASAQGQPTRKLIEVEDLSIYLDVQSTIPFHQSGPGATSGKQGPPPLRPKTGSPSKEVVPSSKPSSFQHTPNSPGSFAPVTSARTPQGFPDNDVGSGIGKAMPSRAAPPDDELPPIRSWCAFGDRPSAPSLLLSPMNGRAVCLLDTNVGRSPSSAACVVKISMQVVALQLTNDQTTVLGELLYYAQNHRLLHRRQRYAALRPLCTVNDAPREWWRCAFAGGAVTDCCYSHWPVWHMHRYLGKAASCEWALKPIALSAAMLRARRLYM